jgi:hypothetical protein
MQLQRIELDGCALVSNTMISEVSRLLSGHHAKKSSRLPLSVRPIDRVTDMCSVIEAIILHDTLYTLPCSMTSDTEDLVLRQQLIADGTLVELDTSSFHSRIGQLILENLNQIQNPVTVAGSMGSPIDFSARIKPEIEAFLGLTAKGRDATAFESNGAKKREASLTDSYEYAVQGGVKDALRAGSYVEFGRALIGWIEYSYSGAYEGCTSLLRDMYYILTSEFLQIPYWPQANRMQFAKDFPNYWDHDLRVALHKKLAEGLQSTIREIEAEFQEQTVFTPPFSALALERCKEREELIIRILELRQEYAGLRKGLRQLESQRRAAHTLRERKHFSDLRKQLLEDVAQSSRERTTLKLETVFRYIPELVKVAGAPTDPTKYSANLFLQPIEWITNWWRQRPISLLFDTRNRIMEMQAYERLLSRLFGSELA